MKKAIIILIIMSISASLLAQKLPSNTFYNPFTKDERKALPYPPLREADVMKSNRVHRIIDSREKMNVIMNWPKNPFSNIIFNAITMGYGTNGPIPAYRSDSLTDVRSMEEIIDMMSFIINITYCPDPEDPTYCYDTQVVEVLLPEETFFKYEIMEDWIFDKQRSMYFPRIIAIAPKFNLVVEDGHKIDKEIRLAWVKWEDLRKILVNQEILNRHNDAMRLTYYDFFELRMFTSYIVKEMNPQDNYIYEFEEFEKDQMAALLESERIKHKLFDWEHDLWEW